MGSISRLATLLDHLYAAASEGTSWEPFLSAIASQTNSLSAAFMSHDGKNQHSAVAYDWGIPEEARLLYAEHYGRKDEWYLRARPQVHTGWVAPSDSLITVNDLRRTEFFNDFLRIYSGAHQCGLVVEAEQLRISSLSLCRTERQGAYSAKDVATLQILHPHIQRAIQLHRRIVTIAEVNAAQSWTLDQVPFGIILMRSNGIVHNVNRAALQLAAQMGLIIKQDGVQSKNPADNARLQQLIRTASTKALVAKGGGSTSIRMMNGRKGALTVTPIKRKGGEFEQAGVAIFCSDPTSLPPQLDHLLSAIYNLTPAEARVATLVASGEGAPSIADHLQVSQETVKSQMKSVFQKTGVSRQSQLATLMGKLPPGVR